jgi:hypothetical protein
MHTVTSPREVAALPGRLREHRSDGICAHRDLLRESGRAESLRSLVPTLCTWPVDSHAVAAEVLDRGANGLIIDGVPLLADLAAGRSPSGG